MRNAALIGPASKGMLCMRNNFCEAALGRCCVFEEINGVVIGGKSASTSHTGTGTGTGISIGIGIGSEMMSPLKRMKT
ncbi:hypothetical protein CSHISOI_08513 [Colletotrichum shisoi]|uniref:Uncharacterized protein n=1 Tax=Colletotrichum shisoi TaxID=2078593 RepID=A0A5Q4BJ16_9PEZI|nr:hypothetical protein CSHISOI_08513 [Colletotrichum shisoi]